MSQDLYALLGLHSDASQFEIKAAYRNSVKLYHPDATGDAATAVQFNLIKQAYEILGDPEKRASYDAERTVRQSYAAPPPSPSKSESASRARPTRPSARPRPRPAPTPPPPPPVKRVTFVEVIWDFAMLIVGGIISWIAFSFALAVVVSVVYLVISFVL